MSLQKVSFVGGLAVLAAVIAPIYSYAQSTATPPSQAGQAQASQTTQAPPANPAAPATATQAAAPTGKSVIVQRILVKVNGEPITQTDLERLQTDALQQMNGDAPPKGTEPDAVIRAQLLKVTPGILSQAIDDLLLIQRAKELGYKMSDEQYTRIVDNIKKDNKLNDADFKKAMADQGLTPETMHANIEHDYLKQAVVQSDVMSHAIMTDQESRQYYAEHQNEFMTQAKVMLREILVAVPTQTVAGQLSFNAATDEAARSQPKSPIHRRRRTAACSARSTSPT
jgi:parvulin-like peptidyl-prolyl isomerase